MSELNAKTILSLCVEFQANAGQTIEQDADLVATAEAVSKQYEDEMADLVAQASAVQVLAFLYQGEGIDELFASPEVQAIPFRATEIAAETIANTLTTEQLWDALPDSLKDNDDAAFLLRENGAPTMANILLNAPKP